MAYKKKSAKEKQAEIKKLFELLDKEVNKPVNGKVWLEYLDTNAEFYNYSLRNQQLIKAQCSSATRVASFMAWKALGREVCAGEKAIRILAPTPRKYWKDKEGNNYNFNDTERPEDCELIDFMAYKTVPVFDVSQTRESSLINENTQLKVDKRKQELKQANGIKWITIDNDNVYQLLVKFVTDKGIKYQERLMLDTTCGYTDGHKIVINEATPNAHKAHTILHEYAHYLLKHDYGKQGRDVPELEAESVAYVVGKIVGLDTADYSFGYLENWQNFKGNKVADVRENVCKTAKTIVNEIEQFVVASGLATAA